MNLERAQHMGRREQLKNEAGKLESSIKGLRSTLRQILDPYKELEDIDALMLHEQAYEMAEKVQQYKKIMLKIRALNEALGDTGGMNGGMGIHG